MWTCLLFVPSSLNPIQRIHKSFYMWPPLWLSVQIIKYWSSTLPVWTPAIITYFQTAQGVKSSTDETRCAPLHVKQSLNALTLKVASIPSPWQPRQGAWCRLAEPAKGWSGVKLPQCPVPHGAWREFNKSNMVRGEPFTTHTHTHTQTQIHVSFFAVILTWFTSSRISSQPKRQVKLESTCRHTNAY